MFPTKEDRIEMLENLVSELLRRVKELERLIPKEI